MAAQDQHTGVDAGGLPEPAVRAQLARITASPAFKRALRLRRFLSHCVGMALAGREGDLKEYSLGVDVFDRGVDFDPRADPIVRVDARRLRKALADYYAGPGAGDPIEVVLPTGSYAPAFRARSQRRADARWSRAFDQEAYELYLRGRRRLNATRPERMSEALSLLRAAAARDPAFADAQVAIAEAHFVSAIFGLARPAEALAAARQAAETALAIDPEFGLAHAQLGRSVALLDRDFARAEAAFDTAITLDPHAPSVRHARAMWMLAPTGRLAQAQADVAALLDQKPYSRRLRVDYARLLTFQGRFDEAVRQLELVLEFEPDLAGGPWALATAYEHAGRTDEARALHERQVRQFGAPYPLVNQWLEAAQALWSGDRARAHDLAARMDAAAEATPVSASVLADLWLRLAEPDRALDWLERAVDGRMLRMAHLAVDPDYASLRGHPRFEGLLSRLGLRPA